MKKFFFLASIIAALAFLNNCGQQTKKQEVPVETEKLSEVSENVTSEDTTTFSEVQTEQPQMVTLEAQDPSTTISDVSVTSTGEEITTESTEPTVFVKPSVEEMQQALNSAGFYQGKIDGVLGPRTKTAIREFQTKNELKVDGKIGPRTWAKLGAYLNKEQSTETSSEISN